MKNRKKLENKVYGVPERVDRMVAEMKLKSLGVKIDRLTPEQSKYPSSWEVGA